MSTDETERDEFSGDDDALAGEYVLGVLDGQVRRAVETRIARDPAFAALVDDWQAKLEPLNEHYHEEAVPKRLFKTIEARLFGIVEEAQPATAAGENGFWQSLLLWRTLTVASLILVAGLVAANVYFIIDRQPDGPGSVLRAELTAENSPVNLVALYSEATGAVEVTPVAAQQDDARSLELWLIPGPDTPPQSLGVIPDDGYGSIVLDEATRALVGEGATFAVSLEPAGGSPSGAPTGPVIAAGTAQRVAPQ